MLINIFAGSIHQYMQPYDLVICQYMSLDTMVKIVIYVIINIYILLWIC